MENETLLRVTLCQHDIRWEEKASNLRRVEALIAPLAGATDLVVLPEMFTTGFSMNSRALAETEEEETLAALLRWTDRYRLAIAGSYIAREGSACYNRGFFVAPGKNPAFYDKRHLFRMGGEDRSFTPGRTPLIVTCKGFHIRLLICYDLRFPVWARNRDNEYDLLLYAANWPASRSHAWRTLLAARAIENCAYVAGVNRVGRDASAATYIGESLLLDPKGFPLLEVGEEEGCRTATLSLETLRRFREKFPVWRDADRFTLETDTPVAR